MNKKLFTLLTLLLLAIIQTPQLLAGTHHNKATDKKVILIHPDGHPGQTGRKLFRGTEHTITKNIAEYLCEQINQRSSCVAVQTRTKAETFHSLQHASFANRLNTDLFISIHAYKEESMQPTITLYHLLCDPITDLSKRTFDAHAFIPVHMAHTKNIGSTQKIAGILAESLQHEKYSKIFQIAGPFGIPFKPLLGILAPAIAIEFGLGKEINLPPLLDPIIDALLALKI
jgi:N-acetylmuramoyl-L-alanine amidase